MLCKQHQTIIKASLKSRRLKATPARLRLLDIFEHYPKPLSAAELSEKFGKVKINLVTIYRNIESLEVLGLLRKITFGGRSSYYELSSRPHHHHVLCNNCGRVSDVFFCRNWGLPRKNVKAVGFASVESHSLEFFGICKNCKK